MHEGPVTIQGQGEHEVAYGAGHWGRMLRVFLSKMRGCVGVRGNTK